MNRIKSSFRDPNGFIFFQDGIVYRQINQKYRNNYDLLMSSGLHEKLAEKKVLIKHTQAEVTPPEPDEVYLVIQPEAVPFISYPYEWSFSQLKSAALTTLWIQKEALHYGMTLKDASAYNIQFVGGKATFIDTLSFEEAVPGQPWVAYRQFCQHFLAPLALMACRDIRLSQLFRVYIDGVPLDLASKLLPWTSHLNFGLLTHIHTHARVQQRFADNSVEVTNQSGQVSASGMAGLIDSLESTVRKLKWKPAGTEWGEYYSATNYSNQAFKEKGKLVSEFLELTGPGQVWDLGANTGEFSRIACEAGHQTVSFDIDPAAVEKNYLSARGEKNAMILPLVLDLTNPSAGIGWGNQERFSLAERGPAGVLLALALIHHLAISNNVPLRDAAEYFADLGRWLIIEFVPKSDSQVRRLLASRVDIFDRYTQHDFEEDFSTFFRLIKKQAIPGTERVLYLFKNKTS
ncbi:MAG: SAM-dependent methyltransferase [Anaerolineaceae bacterium]